MKIRVFLAVYMTIKVAVTYFCQQLLLYCRCSLISIALDLFLMRMKF